MTDRQAAEIFEAIIGKPINQLEKIDVGTMNEQQAQLRAIEMKAVLAYAPGGVVGPKWIIAASGK